MLRQNNVSLMSLLLNLSRYEKHIYCSRNNKSTLHVECHLAVHTKTCLVTVHSYIIHFADDIDFTGGSENERQDLPDWKKRQELMGWKSEKSKVLVNSTPLTS